MQKELLFIGTSGVFILASPVAELDPAQRRFAYYTFFRDLAIQSTSRDLVGASFGRSFYISMIIVHWGKINYTVMRQTFWCKDVLVYSQVSYILVFEASKEIRCFIILSSNPAFGATFTYYLSHYKSAKDLGLEAEARERAKPSPLKLGTNCRRRKKYGPQNLAGPLKTGDGARTNQPNTKAFTDSIGIWGIRRQMPLTQRRCSNAAAFVCAW